jgi:hypothetical protein
LAAHWISLYSLKKRRKKRKGQRGGGEGGMLGEDVK